MPTPNTKAIAEPVRLTTVALARNERLPKGLSHHSPRCGRPGWRGCRALSNGGLATAAGGIQDSAMRAPTANAVAVIHIHVGTVRHQCIRLRPSRSSA